MPKAIAEQEERTTGLDRWSGTAWPNAADGKAATNPATRSNTKNLSLFIKASRATRAL